MIDKVTFYIWCSWGRGNLPQKHQCEDNLLTWIWKGRLDDIEAKRDELQAVSQIRQWSQLSITWGDNWQACWNAIWDRLSHGNQWPNEKQAKLLNLREAVNRRDTKKGELTAARNNLNLSLQQNKVEKAYLLYSNASLQSLIKNYKENEQENKKKYQDLIELK